MASAEGVRVFCFSPIGVEMACNELDVYGSRICGKPDASVVISPYGEASPGHARERVKKVHKITAMTRSGERQCVVVAAAGTPADREALQKILDPSPLQIPEDLSRDAVISVSKLDYAYQWHNSIRVNWNDDSLFKLKKGTMREGGRYRTMLASTISTRTSKCPADTLIVNVDSNGQMHVCVMFVKVPDIIPADLKGRSVALRRGLIHTYMKIVSTSLDPSYTVLCDKDLGEATLFKFESDGDAMPLPELQHMAFTGGLGADVAQHSCKMTMNESGGSIMATTMLVSRGLAFRDSNDIDMPFHTYKNGYLVYIDGVDTSSKLDDNPVLLAAGWVNIPRSHRL
jgi:hypothetical protein